MAGIAGFSYLGLSNQSVMNKQVRAVKRKNKGKGLILRYKPYDLELKHVFTIATSSRKSTPVMLTEIDYEGVVGYGEASMPPYLGESHETVSAFLKKVDLSQFSNPFLMEEILKGTLHEGEPIQVSVEKDHLTFTQKAAAEGALSS